MATSTISGARILGIASAVPDQSLGGEEMETRFGEAEARKIAESSGVSVRRVVPPGMCASDLCVAAARRLFSAADAAYDSVDALIFVSQSPDYQLPATACSIQATLGLPTRCAAFDVNLGCSGYVYGLWLATSLIAAGAAKRVLLLAGDTISRAVSPLDRATAPLFGDAGTATLLERAAHAPPVAFSLGSDGNGRGDLIVPVSGARAQRNGHTSVRTAREGGNMRSEEDLYMNGAAVFAFTLREVPRLIDAVLQQAGWTREEVGQFVFHQANRFMLQHLAKKMKLPADRVPIVMGDYGNTSAASIPLAITTGLRDRLSVDSHRVVLAGFGVGFSWGAAAMELGPLVLPELLVLSGAGVAA